jgi:hypothetical protein
VKRVVKDGGRWLLRSDNPAQPSFDATADTVPIAVLAEHLRPESLAPPVGELLEEAALREGFGIEDTPATGRFDGHLVVVVDAPGLLAAPDRVRVRLADRRPGETAFVLARVADARWRYCGVGRWSEAEGAWAIPDVDFATWRALGSGRECSRRLPAGAEERARRVVEAILARTPPDGWIEAGGKRCRVVGHARSGGIRIDGGGGGFAERTVSLTDLAWVLVAGDDVRERGGVLDEARVNRLRYLDGTPKASTRWIDTGWAIVVVAAVPGHKA